VSQNPQKRERKAIDKVEGTVAFWRSPEWPQENSHINPKRIEGSMQTILYRKTIENQGFSRANIPQNSSLL
jgi:hypothetical protein